MTGGIEMSRCPASPLMAVPDPSIPECLRPEEAVRPRAPRTVTWTVGAAVALAIVPPLAGADWIVTRYDDPVPDGCLVDDCSLREAVIAANATDASHRILLSAGRYELEIAGTAENASATGDLDLATSIELVGPGATMTTIDGNGLDTVLQLLDPDPGDGFRPEITIRGLTVTGGVSTSAGDAGLTASRVLATIEACELRENAPGFGIGAHTFADVDVRDTTIAGNGGGFHNVQADVLIENSTIAGNDGFELQVTSAPSSLTCRHCTIADPADSDLEIFVSQAGVVVELVNSVVAGNCSATSDGDIVSLGGNLESPGDTCTLDQGSDQVSVADAQLGALADNGGPTRTMIPAAESDVLDLALAAECLAADQRGFERNPAGIDCDRGAVEVGLDDPPTPIFHDGFEQGDGEAWSEQVGEA
jgi:hypothetical protein